MKAYTVTFAVEGDDFAAEGSYAVEGDRYYMRVGDAEAYSDGVSKWEVDPSKREVVVDVVDTQSRSLLGNPTRAFDFLDDAFRSELLPSGRRGAPSAAHAGRQGGGDEFDHGRRRRRRIAACGDLRSRRRADAYRDPADRTVGRGAALRCGGLRRLRADRFSLRRGRFGQRGFGTFRKPRRLVSRGPVRSAPPRPAGGGGPPWGERAAGGRAPQRRSVGCVVDTAAAGGGGPGEGRGVTGRRRLDQPGPGPFGGARGPMRCRPECSPPRRPRLRRG